jgi:hypothetical protein
MQFFHLVQHDMWGAGGGRLPYRKDFPAVLGCGSYLRGIFYNTPYKSYSSADVNFRLKKWNPPLQMECTVNTSLHLVCIIGRHFLAANTKKTLYIFFLNCLISESSGSDEDTLDTVRNALNRTQQATPTPSLSFSLPPFQIRGTTTQPEGTRPTAVAVTNGMSPGPTTGANIRGTTAEFGWANPAAAGTTTSPRRTNPSAKFEIRGTTPGSGRMSPNASVETRGLTLGPSRTSHIGGVESKETNLGPGRTSGVNISRGTTLSPEWTSRAAGVEVKGTALRWKSHEISPVVSGTNNGLFTTRHSYSR